MIYTASCDFSQYTENPYDKNRPYDASWALVQLLENAGFRAFTGSGGGVFRLMLTKQQAGWQYHVMDFIEYQAAHNKNIIAAVNAEDLAEAERAYQGHCCTDPFLRDDEPPVLVHATTPEGYVSIMKCGFLKSWNTLYSGGERPIGALLGDPPDFSDYVMFSFGGCFSEIVVAAKQKGRIDMDVHAPYTAGARFYLDAEKVARDGLLVRDGAHVKVRDKLALQKYLLWVATPETVGLPEQTTPFDFGTKADALFQEKFHVRL